MGSRSKLNRTNSAPQLLPTCPNRPSTAKRPPRVLRKQLSVDASGAASWAKINPARPAGLPRVRIFAPGSKIGVEVDEEPQSVRWCGDKRNVKLSTDTSLRVHNPYLPVPGYGRHFPQNKEVLAKPRGKHREVQVAWEDKGRPEEEQVVDNKRQQDGEFLVVAQKVTQKRPSLDEELLFITRDKPPPVQPTRLNLDIFIHDTLDVPSEDDRSSSFSSPVNTPVMAVAPEPIRPKPEVKVSKRRDRSIKSAPVRTRRKSGKETRTAEEESSGGEDEEEQQAVKGKKVLHVETAPAVVTMVSLVSPTPSDNECDTSCRLDHPVTEGVDKNRLFPPGRGRAMMRARLKEHVTFQVDGDKGDKLTSVAQHKGSMSSMSPGKTTPSHGTSRAKELWKQARKKRAIRSAPVPPPPPDRPPDANVIEEERSEEQRPKPVNFINSKLLMKVREMELEEAGEDGKPVFRTEKEEECWVAYQKIRRKGVSLSFDTFLRGMLTPTEYRLLQRDALVVEIPKMKVPSVSLVSA